MTMIASLNGDRSRLGFKIYPGLFQLRPLLLCRTVASDIYWYYCLLIVKRYITNYQVFHSFYAWLNRSGSDLSMQRYNQKVAMFLQTHDLMNVNPIFSWNRTFLFGKMGYCWLQFCYGSYYYLNSGEEEKRLDSSISKSLQRFRL